MNNSLTIPELEIGKEYVLFTKQFDAANHVKYLGGDKEVNPEFYPVIGDRRKGEIGYFKFSRRGNDAVFAVWNFMFELGAELITTTHEQGRLVS